MLISTLLTDIMFLESRTFKVNHWSRESPFIFAPKPTTSRLDQQLPPHLSNCNTLMIGLPQLQNSKEVQFNQTKIEMRIDPMHECRDCSLHHLSKYEANQSAPDAVHPLGLPSPIWYPSGINSLKDRNAHRTFLCICQKVAHNKSWKEITGI